MALVHSAKGSTWKDHKHIKKVDGSYYYPGDYKSGSEGSGGGGSGAFDDKDYEAIVKDVIGGKYGNGNVRKELLGKDYSHVQEMVNKALSGGSVSPKSGNKEPVQKPSDNKKESTDKAKTASKEHQKHEDKKKKLSKKWTVKGKPRQLSRNAVDRLVMNTASTILKTRSKPKLTNKWTKTLKHHGIKGQRWGVRRFQNPDGTRTVAGRRREAAEAMRREGAQEDAASYKYNKSGESGWQGMKRAVKEREQAKADKRRAEIEEMRRIGAEEDAQTFKYQKPGESGWQGAKRAIGANKKKLATAALLAGTVAAAAVYASNPKVRKAVNSTVSKCEKKTVSTMKSGVKTGKRYMKKAANQAAAGVKAGVKEGLYEAPRNTIKVVATGAALHGAKKMMDRAVGKEDSARVFQAANKKKVSSFWKVSGEDQEKKKKRDEDEDEYW